MCARAREREIEREKDRKSAGCVTVEDQHSL